MEGLFGSDSPKPTKKKPAVAQPVAQATVPKPVEIQPASVKPPTKIAKKPKPTPSPPKIQPVTVAAEDLLPTVAPVATVTQRTEIPKPAAPLKNTLQLLHTSALLDLTNKPSEQNEVGVPSAVLMANDDSSPQEASMEKVQLISADRPRPDMAMESATPIQDLGIQSSISDITGQLSEVPVTTIIASTKPMSDIVSNTPKTVTESSAMNVIAPETSLSVNPLGITVNSPEDEDEDSDGGVEIVDAFTDDEDSSEEPSAEEAVETASESTEQADDEEDDDDDDDDEDDEDDSSSNDDKENSTETEAAQVNKVDKKKKKKEEDDDDDDILGGIGGAISETLGLGGSKKKKTNKKETTVTGIKKKESGGILGTITDSLGFGRFGFRSTARQNRMMRFEGHKQI